jgi:hypothetical protein
MQINLQFLLATSCQMGGPKWKSEIENGEPEVEGYFSSKKPACANSLSYGHAANPFVFNTHLTRSFSTRYAVTPAQHAENTWFPRLPGRLSRAFLPAFLLSR